VTPWEARAGAGSCQDLWTHERSMLEQPVPKALWKGLMLEQFMKNCSPWEGLTWKKYMEDCLLWEGPQAGAGEEHKESSL